MLRDTRLPEAQGQPPPGTESDGEGTTGGPQPLSAHEEAPASVSVTARPPSAPKSGLDVEGFLEQQVAEGAGEEAIMRASQSLEGGVEGAAANAANAAHARRGLANKPACAYMLRLAVDPVARRPPHLGGDGSEKPDEAGDGDVEGGTAAPSCPECAKFT